MINASSKMQIHKAIALYLYDCVVKRSHKYAFYLVNENKANINWPNKDSLSISI